MSLLKSLKSNLILFYQMFSSRTVQRGAVHEQLVQRHRAGQAGPLLHRQRVPEPEGTTWR